jgi:hypothetical protein
MKTRILWKCLVSAAVTWLLASNCFAALFPKNLLGEKVPNPFQKDESSDKGKISGVSGTGYNRHNTTAVAWQNGDLPRADAESRRLADKHSDGKDFIIYRLERGAVLAAANSLEPSNGAFDEAEKQIDDFATKAKTNLGDEFLSGALKPSMVPYRGHAYDGIMLNTYKALNFLRLGDGEKAKVELTRASQRQIDAIEANKRRIERETAEIEKRKDKEQIQKAEEDDKLKQQLEEVYGDLDQLKPYANYENPYAVYLDGLVTMAVSASLADNDYARKAFERAVGFEPENAHLKADLAAMEGVVRGQAIPPTTYVIFETGSAPTRDQVKIELPVPGAGSYFAAAFPKLKFNDDFAQFLEVAHGSTSDKSVLLASMDSVIGREFKNDLPGMKTRSLAWAAGKATASGFAGGWGKASIFLLQKFFNEADLRTWVTLPKEVHICRFATPEDRKIVVSTPGGNQRAEITVGEGHFNLVHVRSINTRTPLIVTQTKLK